MYDELSLDRFSRQDNSIAGPKSRHQFLTIGVELQGLVRGELLLFNP